MKEMIVFRPDAETEKLTVRQLKVLREIAKILGERTERVNYSRVGKSVGLTYNGVSYAVEALVRANLLAKEDGKLRLLKRVIL